MKRGGEVRRVARWWLWRWKVEERECERVESCDEESVERASMIMDWVVDGWSFIIVYVMECNLTFYVVRNNVV